MEWEFRLLYWLQSLHNPVLDAVEKTITRFGNGGIFWIVVTVLILIFVKDKRVGMTCALALAAEALLVFFLKTTVMRSRPIWLDPSVTSLVRIPRDYSFPSGHSAVSFATAVSIFCYNRKWGSAAVVFAALIAFSRLYLFVHFPTDVIAGTIIGIAFALLATFIVKKVFPEPVEVKRKNG